MRSLFVLSVAVVASNSVALAEGPATQSRPSADVVKLTEREMDQITAGKQNVVKIWIDGLPILTSTLPGECVALCNNNNQQGGNNFVGDQSFGDIDVVIMLD